ncbi:MAG: Ig domain-containing protein [Clostridium sp.]|nr:Ig domain-containing protein [Clostridium sp.]
MRKAGRYIVAATSIMVLMAGVYFGTPKVNAASQEPMINQTTYILNPKKSVILNLLNPTGKTTWSSSNKEVATVNSKGVVKAKKTGTVKITATNNRHKTSCKITVTDMKMDKTKAKVTVGKNITFKLLKAGNSKVTWKSSDKNVATVNRSGVVTGKKTGSTTITATCKSMTFSSTVTVLSNEKILYTQDISISDLDENTGFIGIKKIAYQNSNLKFTAYAYNNYAQKLADAESITITLYEKGKKIGEQTYKKRTLNVDAHSMKKMTFVMKGRNIKKKNMDLRTSNIKAKVTVGMCSFAY